MKCYVCKKTDLQDNIGPCTACEMAIAEYEADMSGFRFHEGRLVDGKTLEKRFKEQMESSAIKNIKIDRDSHGDDF